MLRCSDGTLYCGKTQDIAKRLRAHNGMMSGGAKYTKGRRPVELVYIEQFTSVTQALKREYMLKQLSREEKSNLIASNKIKV